MPSLAHSHGKYTPANALEWQWDCTWTHGQSLLRPIQNIWHPHWSTFPEQLCFPFSGGVPGSCSKNHHTLWQPQCTWPYILHSVQFNNLPRWYYKKMVMFIMKCNTWLHSCSPLSYSLSMSRAIKTLKETMALILAGQTEYWVWSASFHLPLYCMHSQASAQPDSPTWIPAPLDPQCHHSWWHSRKFMTCHNNSRSLWLYVQEIQLDDSGLQ